MGFWIRAMYMGGFQDQSITAVVRAGDRSNPEDFRCIPAGVDIPVRFIRKPGDASKNIEPELYSDDGTTVRLTGTVVERIRDLTPENLRGTTPDTATPELVQYHLAGINNTPLPSLEEWVTIWQFEYCPKAVSN
jgi:hypothetical protein